MQHTNPLINPVVVLRKEFDDWAVLFNPDTAEAVGINPIGVTIWEELVNQKTASEIINILKHQYSDVPDEVAEEVDTFIDSLAERGFIGFEVNNRD